MKKRKLISLVTVCFVVLYLLSALTFAFMSWDLSEEEEMTTGNSYSLQMQEDLHNFLENLEDGKIYTQEDFDELIYGMPYLFDDDFPTLFALVDNETDEIVVRSKNIVYFHKSETDEYNYVDIEPYMTAEIREELCCIADELDKSQINLSQMSFCTDGDKYIPVEMTVGTGRMEDYKSVKITDYESNVTVNIREGDFLVYRSYNLRQKGYTSNLYKLMELQLEKKINNGKTVETNSTISESFLGVGNNGYNSAVHRGGGSGYKNYTYILIGPAYNEYVETFTNEYFVASMVLQGILFAIAYLIALRVATKIYKKSEQLTRSQRAFTSAAAHELKTPLSVIQNQCECIMENVAPEKNEDYIKSVYDEAVRMNGIVTSFLQYNRLVNADKLQKEKCSLSEIVLTETEKYKAFADMRGVTINAEISADEITVNCNRDLISMAVDNYLSNAIKYVTGDKKVTVKLKNGRFSVYNTCDGISADTAESMWDILSRDNKARTKDGSSTGMGLPICAEIFKAHGYEYGYKNVKDGVEFYFAAK